ncbi:MAG: PLP-dependent aminotransferase family protein [Planctomycetota bacterium]|nr:MAG: PLP-dependent aminotransferase family protein [Planctomycetota bacterium]
MSDRCRLSHRARQATDQPISYLMGETIARPELISLAAGFVDPETLPIDVVAEATAEIFADRELAQAALQYGTTPGELELREAILARHLAADAMTAGEAAIDVEQIVLTAGSNQLLHLIGETLIDPGDIVICASPCYFVYVGTLQGLGARVLGVAADEQGLIPAALEESLQRLQASGELSRVKAIYVASYYDNPTGATIPASRRQEILELAQRFRTDGVIHVIDDVAYRELGYYGDDEPSFRSFDDAGETVIHVGSFSKSFSPGLRIGWAILPPPLVEPIGNQKGNMDFGSPRLNQRIMATVFRRGLYDAHVAKIRASYRVKLEATLAAMESHFGSLAEVDWIRARGGLYTWVTLPDAIDTGSSGPLFARALDEGVLYVPGVHCYPQEGAPIRTNTLRLSFGVQSPETIEQGVAALARAVAEVLAEGAIAP